DHEVGAERQEAPPHRLAETGATAGDEHAALFEQIRCKHGHPLSLVAGASLSSTREYARSNPPLPSGRGSNKEPRMDLFDLTGKVAIVTGGNGGIGLGMARGLAEAGAAIAIVGRNAAKSDAAVAELKQRGGKAISVVADV